MSSANKADREAVIDFEKYTDQKIRVSIQGGREVEGILKGYDKLENLVLDESIEYLRGNIFEITVSFPSALSFYYRS